VLGLVEGRVLGLVEGRGLGLVQSVPNSLHLKSHSNKHIITKTVKPTAQIIMADPIIIIDV